MDPRGLNATKLRAKNDPQGQVKEIAQQFEGIMLQMMLKGLRATTSQDTLFDSEQTKFFNSMLDQQLAQDISRQGSFGIAKAFEKDLARMLPKTGANTDPTNPLEANKGLNPNSILSLDEDENGEKSDKNDNPWFALDLLSQANLRAQTAKFAATQNTANTTNTGNTAKVGSQANANAPQGDNDFVNRIWQHAQNAAQSLDVPPQFLVAQSALESGWGKSEILDANGKTTHNIFGIKAPKNWSGKSVSVPTTEYENGVAVTKNERFKAYSSYKEAFDDYANLLKNNARYANVIGKKDSLQFANALQKSGYATDPAYAQKLSGIIEGATLRKAISG